MIAGWDGEREKQRDIEESGRTTTTGRFGRRLPHNNNSNNNYTQINTQPKIMSFVSSSQSLARGFLPSVSCGGERETRVQLGTGGECVYHHTHLGFVASNKYNCHYLL